MVETLTPGTNTFQDSTRGLITTNKRGGLDSPERIIRGASSAKALYQQVRTQNLKRIGLYAAIEGLISGNPPYNQADLEGHGLGFMTNYNDLSAMARFEKQGLAYWNLLNLAETLVKITLDIDDEHADDWGDILSTNYDKYVLRKWKSFPTMMGTHSGQLVKFGLSALLWPDERDWRPRATELHRFLVPDQTLADLDQMTFAFFENEFTAQYLFEVYNDLQDKLSDDELKDPNYYKYFWNLDTLRQILLYRANTWAKTNNTNFYDFFDLQKALQNGDWTYNQIYSDGIKLITLLYKEYDGQITHFMFDNVWTGNQFAYMSPDQYSDFREVCAVFTVSPEHFTLHSNRGLGHKVFAPCQAKNQLACSMVDMARYSSTPMLRNDGGSIKEPQQVRLYPGVATDIGSAQFVDNRLGNNLQQVVGVLQYLDQNLSINLGMGGDDPQVPDANTGSVSPTQAKLQSYREFGLPKNSVSHFLSQMDHVYENMVAIGLHSKKGYPGFEFIEKWKEKCIEQGVDPSVFDVGRQEHGLPDHMSVKATRVAGDGSIAGLIMGLQELEPILPELSPDAIASYVKDRIHAALGPDALRKYTRNMNDPAETSAGATEAGLENAIMQQGFSPVFSPTNKHKTHFEVHMTLNGYIKQQVEQGVSNPIEAQKTFDHSVPHTQEHFDYLSKSPYNKSYVDKWKGAFKQVIDYATLNKKNAIKMLQAQQQQQQQLQQQQQQAVSEEQIKAMQANAEMKRKGDESQAKILRQDRESEIRGELKKKQVQEDADVKRMKASFEHDIKRNEAARETALNSHINNAPDVGVGGAGTPNQTVRQELANLTDISFPNGEA